nr:FecR family protein [Pseudoflavitalea sp. G-6-1-2]
MAPVGHAAVKSVASKSGSFVFRYGAKLLAAAGITGVATVLYFTNKPSHQKLQPAQAIVIQTADHTNKTMLADSTTIIIDQQSRLIIRGEQPQQTAVLENGAAYFQTNDQHSHLIVQSGSVEITTDSAQLFVTHNHADSVTSVFVQTGSATIITRGVTSTINAGGSFRIDASSRELKAAPPPNLNEMSFATQIFEFDGTPLHDVIPYLEKAYDIGITLKSDGMKNCRISAKFENMPLRQILDIMAFTIGFDYTLDDIKKVVVIDGTNTCP